MNRFQTKPLPAGPDAIAPDGSAVRVLLRLAAASLAHFELGARQTSVAVAHRTVEEIGEMWRKLGDQESVEPVAAGVCATIPVGTQFQFRALGPEPLAAVGVTMPPCPGGAEAYVVDGPWTPTAGLPSREA